VVPRVLMSAFVLAITAAACSSPAAQEPLQLEGNRLTVDNHTAQPWSDVVISVNTYYQVTVPSIPAGGRFQVGLDSFTAGFGRRFDFHRMQVQDVRLTAKRPDGNPVDVKKQFVGSGLAGALGGKR
jgi:hypothetical protein